jgi:DNA-binding response OmpR family regulator
MDYLETEGFSVMLCKDGQLALAAFHNHTFDICLLDVMMPKMDGFSLAKAIRTKNPDIPILFITAKSMKEDKLKGYSIGADDYITKPFDEEELLCKIKALSRRIFAPPNASTQSVIALGNYLFDIQNQSLSIGGKTKRITEKECEILHYLAERQNKVIKRKDLLNALWGENDYFLGRSLDVFLTKMRKYLKEDPRISISNVFGVGFIFNVPEN